MSEAHFIVCHELTTSTSAKWRQEAHPFFAWAKSLSGEQEIAYRQFGFFGDRVLAEARVIEHPVFAVSSTANMVHLAEVRGAHGIRLLLVTYRLPSDSRKIADLLRRPGREACAEPFRAAGLRLSQVNNVRSTAVSMGLDSTEFGHAEGGWLAVGNSVTAEHPDIRIYRILTLMIALERQFLSTTEGQLISRIRPWDMYGRRRILRTLPRVPSTDNTRLGLEYIAMRESLHLDIRREQVVGALDVRLRFIEVVAGGVGILATVASLVAAILSVR